MSDNKVNLELEKLKFEKEKFERQSDLHERELVLKEKQNKTKNWKSPTYIAVFAAIIGLIGNAFVALFDNNSQREIESQKAEAARILEVVKTGGDTEKAAENLKFLLETGLISRDTSKIRSYLDKKKPGEGISLSSNGIYDSDIISKSNISTSNLYCQGYLQYGTPSNLTFNYCRIGYALGFDIQKKMPKWVMYSLSPNKKPVRTKRQDKWQFDPEIPAQYQAGKSFYSRSGYDRGHLVRRTDVTWNKQAEREIYVFSVVVPMHPDVNRFTWRYLEELTSNALESNLSNELFIISGPIYGSRTIENYREIADIPDAFYRIVYDAQQSKATAWVVPNLPIAGPKSAVGLKNYLASIDTIEELTNLDFFSLLPKDKQSALESAITKQDWLESQ